MGEIKQHYTSLWRAKYWYVIKTVDCQLIYGDLSFNKAITMKARHKTIISVLVMTVPNSKHAVMQHSDIFMLDCLVTGVCVCVSVHACVHRDSIQMEGKSIPRIDFPSSKTTDSLLKKKAWCIFQSYLFYINIWNMDTVWKALLRSRLFNSFTILPLWLCLYL